MLQKISKLFAFNAKKALTKVHVMLLISSALKAKLGVWFNCQNFLSGYRIHGRRFIKSHPLHYIFCSAGKQRCFSVSNPQRSGNQVQVFPSHVPNNHTANQCGFSDVAKGIFQPQLM